MVRLLELRIRHFRGIRNLNVPLGGTSLALLGPNGSGKSSVVDALDFLLTGRIARLTGPGTAAVSLTRHGPHVAATPEESVVEGDFLCDDAAAPYTIRRTIATSDALEAVTAGPVPPSLSHYLALAQGTGLHLLTRRQILAFILAKPGERSELISALLRTESIDDLRKELQGASKLAADECARLEGAEAAQTRAVIGACVPPATDFNALTERVNLHRSALGATKPVILSPSTVLNGVPPLATAAADPLQTRRVRDAIVMASEWAATREALWLTEAQEYQTSIVTYRANAERLRTLRAMQLVKAGRLLVETDQCPLCLQPWARASLVALLESRIVDGQDALAEAQGYDSQKSGLLRRLEEAIQALEVLASTLASSHPEHAGALAGRIQALRRYAKSCLHTALDDEVPTAEEQEAARSAATHGDDARRAIASLAALVAALPDLTGAQKAWDELTAVARGLAELDTTRQQLTLCRKAAAQLEGAHQALLRARDEVLQEVYDALAARFTDYYQVMHAHDTDGFAATIAPTKAGLKLEVGFHGLGAFPPAAVHSEGHQDSMGVCLFLSLVEHLAAVGAGPIILDDVVMSVDTEHRRALAQLLATQFKATQFLITTHDRVWWHQLRTVGLVKSKGQLTFPSWSLAVGPELESDHGGVLAEARRLLTAKNVPGAAHALRRTFEIAGPDICDALGAVIRYRADAAWSAGEYMDAALARYSQLLRKARSAAHSWKHDLGPIDERRTALTEVNSTLGGERWAVNAMVHFNEWADLSVPDFEPVLAAHEALYAQFACPQCESLLHVAAHDGDDGSLRCHCGGVNLNLVVKPK